nr:DNA integrity scanning diadenylate cyclase DisA [Corynebacterium sp. c6VSa_13]
MRDVIRELAPGTYLRDGLERILRGRTGALLVLGDTPEVLALCDGGFELDTALSPTRLRELAKMDGAIVISSDHTRIRRANVQLVPNPSYPTQESGTRHRSAERTALQTGVPVVAVSQSMSMCTLYAQGRRHVLDEPAQILSRANQTMSVVERYRHDCDAANAELFDAEVGRYATVADVVRLIQRDVLLGRVAARVDRDLEELGVDGYQVGLRLAQLRGDNHQQLHLLVRDYLARPEEEDTALARLTALSDTAILDPMRVALALELGDSGAASLDEWIVPRGYRMLARVPRMRTHMMETILARYSPLPALIDAPVAELAAIEHVGPVWATHIRDSIDRLLR